MSWRTPSNDDAQRHPPALVSAAGIRNHHIANTAYPLAHDRTWGSYRVARGDVREVATKAWDGIRDMCLYVHVPFCEKRCSFCEYTVVGKNESDDASVVSYFDAMLAELHDWERTIGTSDRVLHGLDIGGGTPSFAPASQIRRVLDAVREKWAFDPRSDISIETTPLIAAGDLTKLEAYRSMGIDRISMGVQVVQPDLLRLLDRAENGAAHHFRAVENIRRAGFDRFNVDLMYGFHEQSLASWEATLAHAIALKPEYITLYRMRYKLTRISHHAPHVALDAVQPLAALSKTMLQAAGYEASPGKTTFSRIKGDVGTSSYLAKRVQEGMPYLGIGLGAQTFTHTTISYNDGSVGKNLAPYLRSVHEGRLPIQDLYDLPAVQMMAKACAVAFYFGEIERAPFLRKFGVPLEEVFSREIEFLERKGWMRLSDRALSLTSEGAAWTPGIIPLFYGPSAQRYLIERDPETATDMQMNRKLALKVSLVRS